MTEKRFYEEVIIAGFGGQGIILAGKLLAQIAMKAGKEVTFMPSYGAEMRGGTANSMVIISDDPIGSPLVTNPASAIIMNKASLKKFGPRIKAGGLVIMNSSLIDLEPEVEKSVEVVAIPADELAVESGNARAANMVAIGAYMAKKGLFSLELAGASLPEVLAKRYHNTLDANIAAMRRGGEFVNSGA